MKIAVAIVLIITSVASPVIAQTSCISQNYPEEASRARSALDQLMSGDCTSVSPRLASEQHMEQIVDDIRTESFTLERAQELFEITLSYRCSFSTEARDAFDALVTEAQIRRFDFAAFTRGEVDLVTPQIMPRQWKALIEESGHLPEKPAPLLVIGCVVTFGAGVGLIWACRNDAMSAFNVCNSLNFCDPTNSKIPGCCYSIWREDDTNCIISVGQNGPDGDYGRCCSR